MSLLTDVANSYIMDIIVSYAMKGNFILDVIMSYSFLFLLDIVIRRRTTVEYEKTGD